MRGLKSMLLFGILCASSVEALHDRKSAISSSLYRPFKDKITAEPTSSHNMSMIQKFGFKLADNLDHSKLPDARTDDNNMRFFSNFSDKDWELFLKKPIKLTPFLILVFSLTVNYTYYQLKHKL